MLLTNLTNSLDSHPVGLGALLASTRYFIGTVLVVMMDRIMDRRYPSGTCKAAKYQVARPKVQKFKNHRPLHQCTLYRSVLSEQFL